MTADELIKKIVSLLKNQSLLHGFTYINKNRRELSQNPVAGFTLCIGVGKVVRANRPTLKIKVRNLTEVTLSLVAPVKVGGNELSRKALCIVDALKSSDLAGNLSDIEVKAPVFDENLCTLYTDITASFEDVIYGEAELCNIKLTVNGQAVTGIKQFEAVHSNLSEVREELLNGKTYVPSESGEYTLSIISSSALNLPKNTFEIVVSDENCTEYYSGCVLSKFEKEMDSDGVMSYIYAVIATGYSVSGNEVQNG